MEWFEYQDVRSALIGKERISYVHFKAGGLIANIAKSLKYLLIALNPLGRKNEYGTELHLSASGFEHDVMEFPENTVEVRSLHIRWILIPSMILKALRMLYYEFNSADIKFSNWQKIFVAQIYLQAIKESDVRIVCLYYYAFKPEIFVLGYLLELEKDIDCHFFVNSKWLDSASSIRADKIINMTEFAHRYCVANKDIFFAKEYSFLQSSRGCVPSAPPPSSSLRRLGYFSSGMMARNTRYLKDEWAERLVRAEKESLQLLVEFCSRNTDVELLIFPHYARGVETANSAKACYAEFLSDNVRYVSEIESAELRHEVTLGVTNESNVFWDRTFMGYKTIIVNNILARDFIKANEMDALCITKGAWDEEFEMFVQNWMDASFDDFKDEILKRPV